MNNELDGYLGENYDVTFHHENFSSIDAVKRQIRNSPYILSRGADHLLHQVLNQIVDLYIPVVDDFDDSINDTEDRIFRMKNASNQIIEEIMDLKRSVNRLIRHQLKTIQRSLPPRMRRISDYRSE